MRIAQVSPLFESVPPRGYGGTERIVYNLTEALVRRGHEVTLYASGDSITSGRLRPMCPTALRLGQHREQLAPHLVMFERLRQEASRYDVIHFHTEYMHFNIARTMRTPTVSTMHGRMDFTEYKSLFREYSELPVVSISRFQRETCKEANWVGSIYHGLSDEHLPFQPKSGSYLAFLGRISKEKRPDRAIQIAKRAGCKIKIAAKMDRSIDGPYIRQIEKMLKEPHVEFIGEIAEREKPAFLGNASALLFPIDWPEPFGLVMIEALAVGTPVIGFRNGSVPEVIDHGVTGFIVNDVDEAVAAAKRVGSIRRLDCRLAFERRFSVERMANEYDWLYKRLLESRSPEVVKPSARRRSSQFVNLETNGGFF